MTTTTYNLLRVGKSLLILLCFVAVLAMIRYGKLDRFDIVACIFIFFNNCAYAAYIMHDVISRSLPKPSRDVEQDIEYFDEGYIDALHDFLNASLQEANRRHAIEEFKAVDLTFVNGLKKVKRLGHFSLHKDSPQHHGPYIEFFPRYSKEAIPN